MSLANAFFFGRVQVAKAFSLPKVVGQLFLESQVTSDNCVSLSDRNIDALKNNLPCQLATNKNCKAVGHLE